MEKSDPFVGHNPSLKLVAGAIDCASRSEWRAADDLFREALLLDSTPTSRISYGVFLSQRERFFEAISIFTPVLDSGNRTAIGIACHNLAAIYRDVGDLDLARRFQWRSTLLQEDVGRDDLLAMANDSMSIENYEAAESLFAAGCDLEHDSSVDCDDGDVIATAGLINGRLNSAEEGIVILFSAYRRHQFVRDYRGMGIDLLNMASFFSDARRFRAERSCLLRAIRCFERVPAPFSIQKARQQLDRFEQMEAVRAFDTRRN